MQSAACMPHFFFFPFFLFVSSLLSAILTFIFQLCFFPAAAFIPQRFKFKSPQNQITLMMEALFSISCSFTFINRLSVHCSYCQMQIVFQGRGELILHTFIWLTQLQFTLFTSHHSWIKLLLMQKEHFWFPFIFIVFNNKTWGDITKHSLSSFTMCYCTAWNQIAGLINIDGSVYLNSRAVNKYNTCSSIAFVTKSLLWAFVFIRLTNSLQKRLCHQINHQMMWKWK